MKFILTSLFALVGCSSVENKKCEPLIDAVVKSLALKYSEFQECDDKAVVDLFIKAEEKVLQCDSSMQVSGINGSSIACSVIPGLVRGLVDLDPLQMQCKKTSGDVESVLKQLLKCE